MNDITFAWLIGIALIVAANLVALTAAISGRIKSLENSIYWLSRDVDTAKSEISVIIEAVAKLQSERKEE